MQDFKAGLSPSEIYKVALNFSIELADTNPLLAPPNLHRVLGHTSKFLHYIVDEENQNKNPEGHLTLPEFPFYKRDAKKVAKVKVSDFKLILTLNFTSQECFIGFEARVFMNIYLGYSIRGNQVGFVFGYKAFSETAYASQISYQISLDRRA